MTIGALGAVQIADHNQIGRSRVLKLAQTLEDVILQVDLNVPPSVVVSHARVPVSGTIPGDCGGNASYTIDVDEGTGDFSGTMAFNGYCSEGVTLTGSTSFSGKIDLNTEVFLQFSLSFDTVTATSDSDSFTISGSINFNYQASPLTVTMDIRLRDNSTGKVYWVNNYSISFVGGPGYVEFVVSGRYYDPDYGHVIIPIITTFRIFDGDLWPSEGVFIVEGDTGIAGGSTMAQLTFHSSNTCEVDGDTNGDGTYDWNSGILDWEDSSETDIEWVASQTLITREYTGGLLSAMNFYRKFTVTSGTGNVHIKASLKDASDSVDVIDEIVETFYVEEGNEYEILVHVNTIGRGLCNPSDTDVMIFSSPSASSTRETTIDPILEYNSDNNEYYWYCVTQYVIDTITLI